MTSGTQPMPGNKFGTLLTILLALSVVAARAEVATANSPQSDLTLSNLTALVLDRNANLQLKLLDVEINEGKAAAERGIFEPEGYVSLTREENNRQNNSEQIAATGTDVLKERNTVFDSGVEALVVTGARVKMGYTISEIWNNARVPLLNQIISTNNQYQAFAGVNVTQPLLKNFGPNASMAALRLAALSSKIAFQEYRRQLMVTVSSAEAAYWSLYLAQEQERFYEESVRTAETLLKDNRTRFEAGKMSELDVLEAESGLGLRRAKLNEARQKLVEAAARVVGLYSESASANKRQIRAVEVPAAATNLPPYQQLQFMAFQYNPDYLAQQEKMEQELVRLGFARNQRLPELNLKGAFGYNGYGFSPGAAMDAIESQQFDSWSAGLELRVPLGGGVKSRNELRVAKAQLESAKLALKSLQADILNNMDTAWHKLRSAAASVKDYQAAVNYNESLLKSALARVEAGKLESRKALEIEADLLEAKVSVVESLVKYQVARVELELIQGAVLLNRHLEITQTELKSAMRKLAGSGQLSTAQVRRVMKELSK